MIEKDVINILGQKFVDNIYVNTYGCWIWVGDFKYRTENNLTRDMWHGARGYVWTRTFNSVIPQDGFLITTCHNIKCVRPEHLSIVPLISKRQRMLHAKEERARLFSYEKIRHQKRKFRRKAANQCAYCGGAESITVDHKIPISWKQRQNIYRDNIYIIDPSIDTYSIDNLQLLCESCHTQKSQYETKLFREFFWVSTPEALTKDYLSLIIEYRPPQTQERLKERELNEIFSP